MTRASSEGRATHDVSGGVTNQQIRHLSGDEDGARWLDFDFRDDDIVISTRSKSGTTWSHMICALLILETPDLPRPLAELSPWLGPDCGAAG